MAEDPQTGPVPSQGRPATGARLAMAFLGVMRTFLIFPAMLLLLLGMGLMLAVYFVEGPVLHAIAGLVVVLASAEAVIATAVGAKWIEDTIRNRYEHPDGSGPDPSVSAGYLVVMMLEIILFFSGFSLLLWIPAEFNRAGNLGLAWPVFWSITAGLAWWGLREVLKRIGQRQATRHRVPGLTPGTPPSGEP